MTPGGGYAMLRPLTAPLAPLSGARLLCASGRTFEAGAPKYSGSRERTKTATPGGPSVPIVRLEPGGHPPRPRAGRGHSPTPSQTGMAAGCFWGDPG